MSDPNRSCDEILDQLPLFVGGDIEDQAALAVAAHLEQCAACRAVEARAAEARAELLSVFEGEVRGGGPNLWPGVRAGLQQAGLVAGPAPPRTLRRVLAAPAVAALAVAALLTVLALSPLLLDGMTGPAPGAGVLDPDPSEADRSVPAVFAERVPETAPSEGGLVPVTDPEDLLRFRLQPGWQDPDLRLTSSPIVR